MLIRALMMRQHYLARCTVDAQVLLEGAFYLPQQGSGPAAQATKCETTTYHCLCSIRSHPSQNQDLTLVTRAYFRVAFFPSKRELFDADLRGPSRRCLTPLDFIRLPGPFSNH